MMKILSLWRSLDSNSKSEGWKFSGDDGLPIKVF